MSSRTRDLLSATLASAGLHFAAELHGVYTTGTTGQDAASRDYWADWFDGERWHQGLSTGMTHCSSGRHDVCLLIPGTHYLDAALSWTKGNTHIVGMTAQSGLITSPSLNQSLPFTPMLTVAATGVVLANFCFHHGVATGNALDVEGLKTASGSAGKGRGLTCRNMYFRGPSSTVQGATTGGYELVSIGGDANLFENCMFGGGEYVMDYNGLGPREYLVLLHYEKSRCSAIHKNCQFVLRAGGTNAAHFIGVEYAPWGGTFHNFQNCSFLNIGSGTLDNGLGYCGGAGGYSSGSGAYFDANCRFAGVTDVGPPAGWREASVWFADKRDTTDGTAKLFVGLANNPDHTA